jgi:hypothetical protein
MAAFQAVGMLLSGDLVDSWGLTWLLNTHATILIAAGVLALAWSPDQVTAPGASGVSTRRRM